MRHETDPNEQNPDLNEDIDCIMVQVRAPHSMDHPPMRWP